LIFGAISALLLVDIGVLSGGIFEAFVRVVVFSKVTRFGLSSSLESMHFRLGVLGDPLGTTSIFFFGVVTNGKLDSETILSLVGGVCEASRGDILYRSRSVAVPTSVCGSCHACILLKDGKLVSRTMLSLVGGVFEASRGDFQYGSGFADLRSCPWVGAAT
jgi:hypothetical protein